MNCENVNEPCDAELIIKEHFWIRDQEDQRAAIPALLLFGNATGYRQLAAIFNNLADTAERFSARDVDGMVNGASGLDEHTDMPTDGTPFNRDLSDVIHIRCGILTPQNRTDLLHIFSITEAQRKQGDLPQRYRALIHSVEETEKDSSSNG